MMNFVYVFVTSKTLTPRDITEILGVPPDAEINRRNLHQEYTWKKGFENHRIKNIERETVAFLKAFSKNIAELHEHADVTLWVNLYVGEVDQCNLHFTPDFLKMLCKLGISLDITVMNL